MRDGYHLDHSGNRAYKRRFRNQAGLCGEGQGLPPGGGRGGLFAAAAGVSGGAGLRRRGTGGTGLLPVRGTPAPGEWKGDGGPGLESPGTGG